MGHLEPSQPTETPLHNPTNTSNKSSFPKDPLHNIVFCHPLKDRIQARGRRKGKQIPYWVEVTSHKHVPTIWVGDHTARRYAAKQLYGQNEEYVIVGKSFEACETRQSRRQSAQRTCAHGVDKKPLTLKPTDQNYGSIWYLPYMHPAEILNAHGTCFFWLL